MKVYDIEVIRFHYYPPKGISFSFMLLRRRDNPEPWCLLGFQSNILDNLLIIGILGMFFTWKKKINQNQS